jgi:hypothetical protein
MSSTNFAAKLLKEVFLGMGGRVLMDKQKLSTEATINQIKLQLDQVDQDFDGKCKEILKKGIRTTAQLKSHLRTLNYDSLENLRRKLQDEEHLNHSQLESLLSQESRLKEVRKPAFFEDEILSFWEEAGYSLWPNHHLDIPRLERSHMDFLGVCPEQKNAFVILVELNRNAPESNVLKILYYLKNSQSLWGFENLTILQIFSPKYKVEKQGKSLSLGRDMARFLGHEFTGEHLFGGRKVRLDYNATVFGAGQYELFSVFWKLMGDKSDEETRYLELCEKLAKNQDFLSLCVRYVEKEMTREGNVEEHFRRLAQKDGCPDDVHAIFRGWCREITDFIHDCFDVQCAISKRPYS